MKEPRVEPRDLAHDGIEFRPYRDEGDLPGLREAVNASLDADGIDDELSLEDTREEFASSSPKRDPRKDCILAMAGGRIAGCCRATWYEELPDKRMYCLVAYLASEFRGSGIWRRLLRLGEARAREVAAGHPAGIRKILQAWSSDPEVDWPALLASEGYVEVRHFWDMVRPIGRPLEAGPLPSPLALRPVEPGHLRAVWEAMRDVAPDHWQYRVDEWTDEAFSSWRSRNEGATGLWQVAWDGERVAGMVLASVDAWYNARHAVKRGLTEHIFVRREWRGKGVARSLVARALEALGREGMDEACLGVDEENPSGALRLYESYGYVAVRKDTWHRKWLERPAGASEAGLY